MAPVQGRCHARNDAADGRQEPEARNLRVIRELEALGGLETTGDLDLTLISRYIASQPSKWAPHTLKGHLLVISKLCTLAVERRRLVVSPFTTCPIKRLVTCPKPTGKMHLSKDEIRRLLALLRQDVETRKGWSQWKARRIHIL